MEKLKFLSEKCRLAVPLLIYMFIYFSWFGYLERTVTKHYTVIHIPLDDYVPFCEIFIIPYLLWFAYVALVIIIMLFTNKRDYIRCCVFLFTGMTIFLIISTLWPNGHHLRPFYMPRDNIFTQMITQLYQTDTSTNIWPSIHVYNSIGAHLAIAKCEALRKHKLCRTGSLVLCISIILSTVLIKQHSVFDMLTAFILAAIMYKLVYATSWSTVPRTQRKRKYV